MKLPGVERVEVNYATGECNIYSASKTVLKLSDIQDAVKNDGYTVSLGKQPIVPTRAANTNWVELGVVAVIVIALAALLKSWDLLNISPALDASLSLGPVFLIGIVASLSTCAAIVGGLLLSASAKYNELHPQATPMQKLKPHFFFNIGRLISYFVLGGVIGLLGSVLAPSPRFTGVLTLLIAVVMIFLAIDILNLFHTSRWIPRMPKRWSHRIHTLAESDKKWIPFVLGTLTFFLPCGFTQSVQLYALTTGSFWKGGLTMLVFALGTMPALMGIGAISSTAKGKFLSYFTTFAGVVVLVLGLTNISSGFNLLGVQLFAPDATDTATADLSNGKQVIRMSVDGLTYSPSLITIKKGVPVEWHINAENAQGCALSMTIPTLGLAKTLSPTEETVITFTPSKTGPLAFTCSMGMTNGQFTVIE